MANIKGLDIFGNNKGLAKIKQEAEAKKSVKPTIDSKEVAVQNTNKHNNDTAVTIIDVQPIQEDEQQATNKRVGAPIRQFDKVYSAKHPLKLSTLLNATSRVLVEKYVTDMTRDELLRTALDEYIKQNLTQEDKQDLFKDVTRELELFREKYPVIPQLSKQNEIIKTPEQIIEETSQSIKNSWGMNHKNRDLKK